jgi:hypothetical protein
MATLRYPIAQALRNRVYSFLGSLHVVNDVATRTLSELAVHYPSSPLSGERRGLSAHAWLLGGGIAPGDRAPDAPLANVLTGETVRVYELLRPRSHVALLFGGASSDEEGCAALAGVPHAIAERFRGAVSPYFVLAENAQRDAVGSGAPALLDTSGALHQRHAAAEPSIVLLRPDGYVGFRSQPADALALLSHLESYLIPT